MFSSLRLKNFRSYRDYTIEFSDGVNIIVGPNASGKTNLLEALYVLSRGKSFRVGIDELVAHGQKQMLIKSSNNGVARSLKVEKSRSAVIQKTFEVDGETKIRLSAKTSLPVALFEPNHLRLLTGSPDNRRNYLDEILNQTKPGYQTTLNKYKRALLQRNRLLKAQPPGLKDEIFVWDIRLGELGASLFSQRIELVNGINNSISKKYSELADKKTKVAVTYKAAVSSTSYQEALTRALASGLQEQLRKGFTDVGPHREDFFVEINNENAGSSASRGETRTLVLALKLFELEELQVTNEGKKPLLLLDDVFSELDGTRRRALTEHLKSYQTIITTTDADSIIEHFLDNKHKIHPLH